jgi:VIT1/CCC1 family predicted Fe2+/Mn2+ transporter
MALGEWLSVQSSPELYERHIAVEAAELEASPEQEAVELAMIYQAKGIPREQAETLARQLMENKDTALDTLVREELTVDPEELGGSAWEAALTSFVLFAVGAILPVLPFVLWNGRVAVIASLALSGLGLYGIGAAITLLTGRSVLFSGVRQLIFGLAAAAVTYGIGHLVGLVVAG